MTITIHSDSHTDHDLSEDGVATTARTPEQIVVEMDRLRRRLRALGDELTAATAARTTERTVDLDLDLDLP